jgi:hypothetical protein
MGTARPEWSAQPTRGHVLRLALKAARVLVQGLSISHIGSGFSDKEQRREC